MDAQGAEWRVTPRLDVSETFTDNVRLAPRGQEESDWVTEVSPGISVRARGGRLQLSADYAFLYKAYVHNSDANGHSNQLRSDALWDAWNKELFVAASASMSQENVSTLGPRAQSNANITGNRTEVRQANISPYWVRNIGTWARLDARYSYTRLAASGDYSIYDTTSNSGSFGVSSGTGVQDIAWGVNYKFSKYDSPSGSFENRETESLIGNLRYRVTPTFALTATAGQESNDYNDISGSSVSGATWSIGGDWAPSSRTHISGAWGERYFGNTYRLNASHRSRLTAWNLSYVEDVNDAPFVSAIPASADTVATVDTLFRSRVPDPLERQRAVQSFILQNGLPLSLNTPIQFLTNNVTLMKTWSGGVGVLGTRGTLAFNVFWSESSNLSVGAVNGPFDPFSVSDTIEQVGYSVAGSWRLSERSVASATFGESRSKYQDTGSEDTDRYFRIGVSQQLQPKIRGAINYRLNDRDSDDPASAYREHSIIGTLNITF